ncbi:MULTISPECIES: 50S ribosomal protein L22 [Anaerofustis]|jgi:large subunit ribosomal protein L22|uniref:50S ribosomal protein L22 n=1 Tax=Anaerofustis TaxID=264995 RepID=UPI0011073508|nr:MULTISPECIES: 50S ribosomal protein L22 [Anaerofustis]MCO8194600.1 50S ribosomal protein L22 [Anaerofustis sp. NSJ-163]
MEAKATAKYLRVSPIKVKRVASLVRGKDLGEAINILKLTGNKPAREIEKVVKSAAANAENNHDMDVTKLYISEISANQGPTLKRFRAGSQGRASMILKRSSHISVVLKERA